MLGAEDSTKINMSTKKGVKFHDLLCNFYNINEDMYLEAVYQRAKKRLCDYPLCNGKLRNFNEFEVKHWKIKDDIRSKFCSTSCYKANAELEEDARVLCRMSSHRILSTFPRVICAIDEEDISYGLQKLQIPNLKLDDVKTSVDVSVSDSENEFSATEDFEEESDEETGTETIDYSKLIQIWPSTYVGTNKRVIYILFEEDEIAEFDKVYVSDTLAELPKELDSRLSNLQTD